MLTLRQNGLLQLKLDLTNMLPRPCPPYSTATATLNICVAAKLSTFTCTELVLIVAEVVLGGDQGEKK
ncbi:MAG: hypothetical protein EAZ78_09760 [Oscillatoriales cyanobacterium]|nr:MAG: hypothetical protein EA000_08135 [Oscillatoriales cyanobacterium]TAD94251.1 MAG: hypothetical protein EAZ98_19965 [Oscillatoriales cyanobacterium]TAE06725.1 MAG: hypothetical protein EAZ96_01555 [Oscillatoriales cyanobacterium]TAF04259.1 MAG: hypothetical protein EAZ78_09760 [Oscillatoriales cyanobacterium]TAF47271.1 MAG: hypothetical protein EAZ68_02235 [Oscillatoriales cyanobacterium]